jgi:hypothetical protein
MRPECSHILVNGQKCRCLALRGTSRCLHHCPTALRPPAQPARPLFSRISRWRDLSRTVHTLPASDIPYHAFAILGSLIPDGDEGISDREAGRLLRALLRRHGAIPFPPPAGAHIHEENPASDPAPALDDPETARVRAEAAEVLAAKLFERVMSEADRIRGAS